MKNSYLSLLLLLLTAATLRAQEELGTHFLRNVWQSNESNPAFIPNSNVVIGLPGLYNNIQISNLTYNDLIGEDEEGNTVLTIDPAIELLDDKNIIRENLRVNTLAVGFRINKLFFTLGHNLRFNALLDYPKALPQVVWQGNALFIGETVDVGADLHVYGLHDFYVGAAIPLTDRLTIGGRARLLSGVADISTERTRLALTTGEENYALTLDADFTLNSSGTITYDGFDELQVDFDFDDFTVDELFNDNVGFAFDLGAQLDLGKLNLAASVLNMGQLNWEGEVSNLRLEETRSFSGLDAAQRILDDSTDFGSVIDTLETEFELVETNLDYNVGLPLRVYLSGAYQLSEQWQLGALVYWEDYRRQTYTAVALNATTQLAGFLDLGATYAYRAERFDNLGLNLALRLGPIQLLAATDNIITVFQLEDANSSNVRLGLNLLFGRRAQEQSSVTGEEYDFF